VTIAFVPHDPQWRIQAGFLIRDLVALFGPLAERIDHVGSTAIPGIAAKSKLHLDVSLAAGVLLETAKAKLNGLGYIDHGHRFRADEVQLTRPAGNWFGADEGVRPKVAMPHRLTLCSAGCPSPLDRKRFRDALQRDTELAEAYERLKRRLAECSNGTIGWSGYAQGKSTFIAAALTGVQMNDVTLCADCDR